MRFGPMGWLYILGLVLAGMTGAVNLARSFEIRKPWTQFRSGPEMSRALTVAPAAQKSEKETDSQYQLRQLEEWRTAAVQHEPGKPDSAAVKMGSRDERDLGLVIQSVTKLASQPAKKARRTLARASIRRILQLTDQEVKRGDLNRALKQGAMLHTDVVLLGLETKGYLQTSGPTVAIDDGHVGVLPKTLHLEFARRLMNAVSPTPSKDPLVRQWYIATTAHLQSRRLLAYARQNLESALEIFPSDDRILFYAGVLHETWASSLHQNILLPPTVQMTYGSKESELKRARQLFQKSIESNPNSAETRLRLGRVLGLLGHHRQAVAELEQAAALIKDPQLMYYGSLYLGGEYAMLSRPGEARGQYERAAALYPAAQSPLFALSHLADSAGDFEGASLAIQRVFELPRADSWKDDPWWTYDVSPVRDADALVAELRRMFGGIPQ